MGDGRLLTMGEGWKTCVPKKAAENVSKVEYQKNSDDAMKIIYSFFVNPSKWQRRTKKNCYSGGGRGA
jgi:hypothetical protein